MKKPFIEVCRDGHTIAVINTFKDCSLYIDGTEADTYHGIVEVPFILKGKVDQNMITVTFDVRFCGGVMKLFYNDELLAKKFHF